MPRAPLSRADRRSSRIAAPMANDLSLTHRCSHSALRWRSLYRHHRLQMQQRRSRDCISGWVSSITRCRAQSHRRLSLRSTHWLGCTHSPCRTLYLPSLCHRRPQPLRHRNRQWLRRPNSLRRPNLLSSTPVASSHLPSESRLLLLLHSRLQWQRLQWRCRCLFNSSRLRRRLQRRCPCIRRRSLPPPPPPPPFLPQLLLPRAVLSSQSNPCSPPVSPA